MRPTCAFRPPHTLPLTPVLPTYTNIVVYPVRSFAANFAHVSVAMRDCVFVCGRVCPNRNRPLVFVCVCFCSRVRQSILNLLNPAQQTVSQSITFAPSPDRRRRRDRWLAAQESMLQHTVGQLSAHPIAETTTNFQPDKTIRYTVHGRQAGRQADAWGGVRGHSIDAEPTRVKNCVKGHTQSITRRRPSTICGPATNVSPIRVGRFNFPVSSPMPLHTHTHTHGHSWG